MLFLAAVESCRLRIEHCISHLLVGLLVWLEELYSLIWVYLHRLVKLLVLMDPLMMPPVSQRCPSLHIESMLPTFSHHFPLWSCSKEVEALISSTLYNVVEYLMFVDGGCLSSLLLVDSIPSTSDHLFWNRSLESFDFLETYSHQW